jgi:hypothetical protein
MHTKCLDYNYIMILTQSETMISTTRNMFVVICVLLSYTMSANSEPSPFIFKSGKEKLYEDCGELIPSFSYNLNAYKFVNNTLHNIKTEYDEAYENMPERCRQRLDREIGAIEMYRKRSRCSLVPLTRLCPAKHSAKKRSVKRVEVVFIFIMGVYWETSIASAERIVSGVNGDWIPRIVFHVDDSSPIEMWKNVTEWVDGHPSVSLVVPKGTALDVEWGDASIVYAYILSMRQAVQKWKDVTTFVSLSESHILVATPKEMGTFFKKYGGLNFPGMPPDQMPGDESTWKFWLNDAVFPCGRKMYHIGWKTDPISAEDNYYQVGDAYSFWSRDFIDWALFSSEGEVAMRGLFDRMQYATTIDELFWGTLFYNSPFCHEVAMLDDIQQGTAEFSAVSWNRDCDNSDNTGKDLCMSMTMQPLSWWYGTSAEYITPGDVPLLQKRKPVFARKLRPDGLFSETISLLYANRTDSSSVDEAAAGANRERLFYISVNTRSRTNTKKKCAKIVAKNGLMQWVECPTHGRSARNGNGDEYEEEGGLDSDDDVWGKEENGKKEVRESESSPTPFKLSGCIGDLIYGHDEIIGDGNGSQMLAADVDFGGSSIVSGDNVSANTPEIPVRSRVLPSGYMYGHCAVMSTGNIKTSSLHTFCLSQVLLRLQSNDPWSYQDIAPAADVDSTIGFLPCDPEGTVGAAQQMFVFQYDGSLSVATRLAKDIRVKNNAKATLCLVLVKDKIKLKPCSKIKASQKLHLIAV